MPLHFLFSLCFWGKRKRAFSTFSSKPAHLPRPPLFSPGHLLTRSCTHTKCRSQPHLSATQPAHALTFSSSSLQRLEKARGPRKAVHAARTQPLPLVLISLSLAKSIPPTALSFPFPSKNWTPQIHRCYSRRSRWDSPKRKGEAASSKFSLNEEPRFIELIGASKLHRSTTPAHKTQTKLRQEVCQAPCLTSYKVKHK